jgi:choice-of-anchor A domain-containing protein
MPRISKLFSSLFLLAVAIGPLAATPLADVAFNYNVFVTGNFTAQYSDIEGGLAAGGTVNLNGYYVGMNLGSTDFSTSGGYSLVAATDLIATGGTGQGNVYDGSAGGLNGFTVFGKLTNGGGSPIDFAAAGTELSSLSALLAASPTSAGGGCALVYSTVTCTATEHGINYINVSDAVLTSGSEIKFVSKYSDATIILNVSGLSSNIGGGGWTFVNTSSNHVLLNFYDASALSLNGSLSASILASGANVTGTWGAMNGTLIAKSYNGSMQFNNHPFTGELPHTATPEPATFALAGMALLGLSVLRRRGNAAGR